ncbi:hypothetical protein ACFL6N_05375 [Thermodesulfobacteriota bacterium]
MELERERLDQILDAVFGWSKQQQFLGHNKHDGLNSPLLRAGLGWAKWPRIVAIQSVMRAPVNIRPLLLVPKTRNPKGLALYTLGLLDRYKTSHDKKYLTEAENLLELLLISRSPGTWSGLCWGYPYPWQDLGFFAPPHTPNAVVTCFVCEAFLAAYELTGNKQYLDVVLSAADFFLNDLTILEDSPETLCLAYMPLPMTMRVMDVSILIGAVLSQLAHHTGDAKHMSTAARLVKFVVSRQTDYHAWFYTDPPGDSLIRHDNYHTGFILDALWRYMKATDDWQWKDNYEQGLTFYAKQLFNDDGAPRWMSDKDYPHDIHGAAQGLVSFALATENGYDYQALLQKISTWSLENMYDPEGRFYYQQHPYYTKKFTLLRWCNGWMFRGLSAMRTVLDSSDKPRQNEITA